MSAPTTPAEQRRNEQAMRLAASEVRWLADCGSIKHRASLDAWRAGERDTPWPDEDEGLATASESTVPMVRA